MNKSTLTQSELKELLEYNPDTGTFVRISGRCSGRVVNSLRHDNSGNTYYRIVINEREYALHRLAFLYMNGSLPTGIVDHINRNGLDNRWCNLRESDHSKNGINSKLSKNNTSGHVGVSKTKSGKWSAVIGVERKSMHLGTFNDISSAIKARELASNIYLR